MNYLFFENKIIRNKVDHNVQQRVSAAAGNIAEGLPVDPFLHWYIKKIKYGNDKLLQL